MGFAIVRGEIRRTCATLNNSSNLELKLHLKLAHLLRADLWNTLDACAALRAEKEGCASRKKQNNKYELLFNNAQGRSKEKEEFENLLDLTTLAIVPNH